MTWREVAIDAASKEGLGCSQAPFHIFRYGGHTEMPLPERACLQQYLASVFYNDDDLL